MAPRVKARATKPEDLGSDSIKGCVENWVLLSKVAVFAPKSDAAL